VPRAADPGEREPQPEQVVEQGLGAVAGDSGALVADVPGALADAEVVVLAVPGPAVAGVVRENAQALGGKLVVDCANNMGGSGPPNSHDTVVSAAPGVRYARAFNSLGVENLQDPHYGDVVGDMFYTSAEADREIVEQLVDAVGLRPVWLGDGAVPLGIAGTEGDVVAGGGERAAEGSADAAGAENGDLHAGAVRTRGGRWRRARRRRPAERRR
jgi:hypothetical protein